jgi:vacuolar-type H+-ATPase subunit I/STV1
MEDKKVPLKRTKYEDVVTVSDPERKVDFDIKLKHFREFVDNIREIQDLELRILDLKKKNNKLEEGYPDLAQVEGIHDKWYKEDMVTAITSDGRKRLFGSNSHEAKDAYEKKKAKTEENRKKNKELAAKKKAEKKS